MKWHETILIILVLSISTAIVAQEEQEKQPVLETRGYIKDMQGFSVVNNMDSISTINLVHNRINFKINVSQKISARLEVRNRIFWGDQVKQIPGFGKIINRYNGLVNLSHTWVSKQSFVMHSVIDRLLVQYQTEKWDIKLGRQRINWGINTTWNPNDIFNAYDFLDFDYEERPGNDGIRIQHFTRSNQSWEFACKPGKKKNETIAALLYKFNKRKTDWQVLAGLFQQDWVAGTGWAGNIRKAGFKGEVSYFHPRKNSFDTSGIISLSLMADQTFEKNWYISLAALFNSNPPGMQTFGSSIYGNELTAKQLFPFRYSFYAGFMKSFSPVLSLNGSVVYATEKNTLILFPSLTWNASTNFDINLITQSFFSMNNGYYKSLGNSFFLRIKLSL
ncbi:MAG TPA: hypothetical protein VFV31_09160 [Chitinophagaceae bacterium]|nr:hypothetical protein [Chitinophagaceae bacterium]